MKLKKLGAFAATGAMALALALTGCAFVQRHLWF